MYLESLLCRENLAQKLAGSDTESVAEKLDLLDTFHAS